MKYAKVAIGMLAAGLLFLAVLVLTLTWLGTGKAHAAEPTNAKPGVSAAHHVLPACLSDEGESAFACVWFAPTMGNHEGNSFRIYKDGRVKTITDRRAFVLLGECDSDGPIYCR